MPSLLAPASGTRRHRSLDGLPPSGEEKVVSTPGHTPGHLARWQPEERLLVVDDALSDYDVGWVNLALDGPEAAATALASLQRLADLAPRVLLPAHGPIPADTNAAFASALRRAQRLVDDPAGAVWYGACRIFAFAPMIRDGIRPARSSHISTRATRPRSSTAAIR
ncbi:MBL fold metallo-hydrolase [Saccharopolyspora sp. 5N102]|uniref:MBL fold metallo-hydrolase n=1 Tax=Saccharopolyspora sp. 5N102 TaxID=3375155 RepID=UPI0037BA5FE8